MHARIARTFQRHSTSIFYRVHAVRKPIRFNGTVKFKFYEESADNTVEVEAKMDKRVLDVALDNNVDIEGACGGELACSTCHVIVPKEVYDKLPPKQIEEEDMLDLAFGVSET